MYRIFSRMEPINTLSEFAERPDIFLNDVKPCFDGIVVYYYEEQEG